MHGQPAGVPGAEVLAAEALAAARSNIYQSHMYTLQHLADVRGGQRWHASGHFKMPDVLSNQLTPCYLVSRTEHSFQQDERSKVGMTKCVQRILHVCHEHAQCDK